MGRLVSIDNITEPDWYFSDECYEYINLHRVLKWPNPCFAHYSAINFRILENPKTKIEIRKWIEQNTAGTVITRFVNKSYRVYYGKEEPPFLYGYPIDMWDKSYDVKLIWLAFYFEEEDSATAFRLRFSDIISEIIEREPEHLDKITQNRRD